MKYLLIFAKKSDTKKNFNFFVKLIMNYVALVVLLKFKKKDMDNIRIAIYALLKILKKKRKAN